MKPHNYWIYIPIYVDNKTGEVLTREIAKSNYYTIKSKTNHYEHNKGRKERTIIYECEHNGQTKLFK